MRNVFLYVDYFYIMIQKDGRHPFVTDCRLSLDNEIRLNVFNSTTKRIYRSLTPIN